MKLVQAGQPHPLGATWTDHGVNFALYSTHATRVEVGLFASSGEFETLAFDLPGRTGAVWHGMVGLRHVGEGMAYAFRVHGPDQPQNGLRFDDRAWLIDPHARRIGEGPPMRSLLCRGQFDWQGDRPPAIPLRDTLLYELHVKGFTKLHPEVPPEMRGTYLGLAQPEVIRHLREIGVTAVELLPVQAFEDEPFLTRRGLVNYWGYNSVAWFAPSARYAVRDPVVEFKTMVRSLHAAGLEVILDVVFNHTAEGSDIGPLIHFMGIDNPVYYRLLPDKRQYENMTGTGNTVNCEHPHVRALIVDCLKYWVEEMHVDGFRFDLATVLARDARGFNEHSAFFAAVRAEPALAHVKLIAEPWDIGWGGYQLGRFPAGWCEWNDRFRDTARGFWKRDPGRLGEFAERFAGSSDLFRHNGRKPTATVNFVTAHDGFTLHDLVSYNERHNEATLEDNADGASNNLSWNCGAEGPTEDEGVRALRRRQMRNLLATLLLAQGVPMLQAGDEFGRSQRGNNNAYCQDNELSWIDWSLRDSHRDLWQFVKLLSTLRREHAEFRRETFLKGTVGRGGAKDVSWLHYRGGEMTDGDWHDGRLRTLGVLFGNRNNATGRLLILINAADTDVEFAIPVAPAGHVWRRRFDTTSDGLVSQGLGSINHYPLGTSCVALLEC